MTTDTPASSDRPECVVDPDSAANAPTAGPPPPHAPKRLTKRKDGEMIDGVCTGIAAYFAVDPVLVRLGFVAAVFAGGAGLVAYLVAMVIMPEESAAGSGESGVSSWASGRRPEFWVGVGLIGVAVIVLLSRTPWDDGGLLVPLGLIIAGVVVWRNGARSASDDPDPSTIDASAAAPRAPAAADPAATPVVAAPHEPGARRSVVARVTLAIALVAAGGVLAAMRYAGLGLGGIDVVAVVTVVLGVGLVVSAWWGRARSLIGSGVVATVVLLIGVLWTPTLDLPIGGGVGEELAAPTAVADLETSYDLLLGQLTLDLSDLDLAGEDVRVEGRVGIGQLVVEVPDDAEVVVTGSAGVGEVDLFGADAGGLARERTERRAGTPGTGTLELDLSAAVGQVEVTGEPAT